MRRHFPIKEPVSTGIAVVIVLAFFAADIIESAGWDWREWTAAIVGRQAKHTTEIRNYVEFVSVPSGSYRIVTGIEFDSSYQRRITKQWCYVERPIDVPGAAEIKLSLAHKDAAGITQTSLFTSDNLLPLGLTEAGAKDLIAEHCRFR